MKHTALAGIELATFRLLVRRATSSATETIKNHTQVHTVTHTEQLVATGTTMVVTSGSIFRLRYFKVDSNSMVQYKIFNIIHF